jgi:RNA polymerase sigma-70 factor (ECF subfamily)
VTVRPPNDGRSARFEAIFDQTYEPVLAYARRRAPADADDVVAETFAIAWRRLEHVPGDALPWLYGVARRVSSEERRAGRRREALLQRMRRETSLFTDGEAAREQPVFEALAQLGTRDREAIMLVAWEGLSAERAATAMGCSTVAFRVRLHRARARLRARLEEDEMVPNQAASALAEEVGSQ